MSTIKNELLKAGFKKLVQLGGEVLSEKLQEVKDDVKRGVEKDGLVQTYRKLKEHPKLGEINEHVSTAGKLIAELVMELTAPADETPVTPSADVETMEAYSRRLVVNGHDTYVYTVTNPRQAYWEGNRMTLRLRGGEPEAEALRQLLSQGNIVFEVSRQTLNKQAELTKFVQLSKDGKPTHGLQSIYVNDKEGVSYVELRKDTSAVSNVTTTIEAALNSTEAFCDYVETSLYEGNIVLLTDSGRNNLYLGRVGKNKRIYQFGANTETTTMRGYVPTDILRVADPFFVDRYKHKHGDTTTMFIQELSLSREKMVYDRYYLSA